MKLFFSILNFLFEILVHFIRYFCVLLKLKLGILSHFIRNFEQLYSKFNHFCGILDRFFENLNSVFEILSHYIRFFVLFSKFSTFLFTTFSTFFPKFQRSFSLEILAFLT